MSCWPDYFHHINTIFLQSLYNIAKNKNTTQRYF
jgi:hypothetical protein